MLCEDAYLHSASNIVILWPYAISAEQRPERVRLGRHQYKVEIISRPKGKKSSDVVVGFAINVSLSKHTERDFRDFCLSLVAGYGWNLRGDDGPSLLLENEGEAMRIWPVTSTIGARHILHDKNEYGRSFDLIISNQSISDALRDQARRQKRGLVHYSELGRWMRDHYRLDTFTDL